jgi:multidrug transporter EmrE-like cation transporter
MIYLFLAIISSSSIALIFKFSESRNMNRYAVTTVNYLAAVLVSGSIFLGSYPGPVHTRSLSRSLSAIWSAVMQTGEKLSPDVSPVWALVAGSLAGTVFFLAFIYYQIAVREQGVGLAGAFAKIGILVPLSLSLVFWREYPAPVQWLGIGLAVASILLINVPGPGRLKKGVRTSLIALFLFAGLAEFSNKIFQKHGLQVDRTLFLCATFGVAFVLSLIVTLRKKQRVHRRDILTGIAVGIPNLFSSYFLIMALEAVPAAVAFAAFGAGTILVINLGGAVIFGERLSAKEKAVIALTAVSLILMNL